MSINVHICHIFARFFKLVSSRFRNECIDNKEQSRLTNRVYRRKTRLMRMKIGPSSGEIILNENRLFDRKQKRRAKISPPHLLSSDDPKTTRSVLLPLSSFISLSLRKRCFDFDFLRLDLFPLWKSHFKDTFIKFSNNLVLFDWIRKSYGV